jgi:GT2 family glycosyltransferase
LGCRLIENRANVGFGAAVNQGFRLQPATYLGTLNDDAVAEPGWLEALVEALEGRSRAGMAASRIELAGGGLDSAGLLVARDGSSKQRGHRDEPGSWSMPGEALAPSGCAALYRAAMLDEIGLFDEEFFLYCEDTDLGLRGQWAGWSCQYVPEARVEHRYSASAGRASAVKAYLVERNRLRLTVRVLPAGWLLASPAHAALRYFWHAALMARGRGKAAEFRQDGGAAWRLPWLVLKAHLALAAALPRLLTERRAIARTRRRTAAEFTCLLKEYAIGVRQVAAQ